MQNTEALTARDTQWPVGRLVEEAVEEVEKGESRLEWY